MYSACCLGKLGGEKLCVLTVDECVLLDLKAVLQFREEQSLYSIVALERSHTHICHGDTLLAVLSFSDHCAETVVLER
jgi:hypothetical protein